MAVNTQIIEIVTKFVDGASKKIREVSQRVEEMGGGMQRVTNTTKTLNERTNKLGKTMETQRLVAKRFQMQWLSILFFGFALQRMFSGLIRTSLEWTGVTEIMSLALGILFLPLAEILLGWAILFLDAVSKLSPEQKKWIGLIVLSAIVVGALLMGLGQLALGLAGVKWLVGSAGIKSLGTAATATTGKLALLRAALGKIILVAIGITIAWVGFKFLTTGIEEGSILKEMGGIIGIGLGLGAIGLAIGGPWGAGIGFVIGVTGAIIIDWVLGGKAGKAFQKVLAGGTPLNIPGLLGGISSASSPISTAEVLRNSLSSQLFTSIPAEDLARAQATSTTTGQPLSINTTYNVSVSDKAEFENMLRENNISLTEDVRRLVKV